MSRLWTRRNSQDEISVRNSEPKKFFEKQTTRIEKNRFLRAVEEARTRFETNNTNFILNPYLPLKTKIKPHNRLSSSEREIIKMLTLISKLEMKGHTYGKLVKNQSCFVAVVFCTLCIKLALSRTLFFVASRELIQ